MVEPEVKRQPECGWAKRLVVGRDPRRTVARAAVLAAFCILFFNYVLLPIRVEGISMMPAYRENGVNLVNRLAYVFREPHRGDVVAIKLAGRHLMYMKRIIALPGETIGFRDGRAYVNGRPLPEDYVKLPCGWERQEQTVSAGSYYVVGDNRSMDFFDHVQGQAERRRILGKVML
jgi:signal peptidase I